MFPAHFCNPTTGKRNTNNYHTENVRTQKYRYYAGVCQDIGGSKEGSGRENKNPINDNKMKKQLFDLTIEEFTSVLLDYQPTLELSFCCYDEKGNFINKQITDSEDEEVTVRGTYSDFYNAFLKKPYNNGVKEAVKGFLDSHFDYDMQLNRLDIYNYLEHITSNFHEERIRIVLNEMDCFYNMVYLEDIDSDVQEQYIEKGWEIPTITRENKINGQDHTFEDFEAMREKIYPCREFMYHNAIGLLNRKLQATKTSSLIYSDDFCENGRTMKITTDVLVRLLDKTGINENNSDKTKIAKLISYITGFSENTIRQRLSNQEELTSKHKDEIERVNKILSGLNIGISIKYNKNR